MRVEDVMTRDVITVRPETTIHEAAALMVIHGVSGLPVVDDARHVVGILSEGDLILRQKGRRPHPWWRGFLDVGEKLAQEYRKYAGATVADVMTRSVLCVPGCRSGRSRSSWTSTGSGASPSSILAGSWAS